MMERLKKNLASWFEKLFPTESLSQSKRKWNRLGRRNPRYFVWTTKGQHITEEELEASGSQDYQQLVANDRFLHENLGDFSSQRVLEVGCGIGRMTKYFAQDFLRVDGTDISDELVRVGTERLKDLPNVHLVATDGKTYPFTDASFDFVFSYLVFQHMADVATVEANLREVARVMKPGGIAKIQLRGVPIRKFRWSYGVWFNRSSAEPVAHAAGLRIVCQDGEGEKNLWLWFTHT